MCEVNILVANRGEIAVRIFKTCKKLGFNTFAIYTEADAFSLHVKEADHAILLPDGPLSQNYLNMELIVEKAKQYNITAIHPGYGFLSESCEFAHLLEEVGLVWVGPTSKNISDFTSKHISKALARECLVPTLPNSKLVTNVDEAKAEAENLGYPVMIKCSDGGGGIGIFKCENNKDMEDFYPIAAQKSKAIFASTSIYLEKFLPRAHHIEIQIIGDGKSNIFYIGERECSAQRRNQKIIEETPSPFINPEIRKKMLHSAVKLAKHIQYKSVGTVEFIVDHDTQDFYFLEVNTRLQVEHPVTEMTFGIDVVELMLNIALERSIDWIHISNLKQKGHAIEARIYAENAVKNYQPSSGRLSYVEFPETGAHLRIDTWIESDVTVSPYYDPLLAKIIAHGDTREEALEILLDSLSKTTIQGIVSNVEFLSAVIKTPEFKTGQIITAFLDGFKFTSYTAEVIDSGLYSLIQDFPGRVGYWDVGIPPSGPMDPYAFKVANYLVENSSNEAAIEILLDGLSLKFNCDSVIAVAGAECVILVDSNPAPMYETINIPGESEVKISLTGNQGCRAYLAIQGGIKTVPYLGSRSTFPSGNFGGLSGGPLKMGDFIPLSSEKKQTIRREWPEHLRPKMTNEWTILAMGGPHGAPDYFTVDDIETLWDYTYTVSHNANRLGIRVSGFTPKWARTDGGDAGIHPSSVHDYPYGIGCVNFSGNTPIILTVDGPSLGGFVCPITIIQSEMWKIGQLRPGDTFRFKEVNYDYSVSALLHENSLFAKENFEEKAPVPKDVEVLGINPIIGSIEASNKHAKINFRAVGDSHILIDIAMKVFGLDNRFLIQFILNELKKKSVNGLLEFIPGVSSLLIKYDAASILNPKIIEIISDILISLKSLDNLTIDCRKVLLPVSFRDKWTLEAIQRYQKTIRSEAPYLPDNCEFIKQINSLDSLEDVANTINDATYLVLGLGDVYLGAPCAVPIDPRHRIVTTKYNPARTFTPEGAVGIGGIYMCIYGMDSPGGYQLVGRSLPIWYTFNNPPWLLDFFDHVKFYLVSDEELLDIRRQYRLGKMKPNIEPIKFSLGEYKEFINKNKESIEAYEKDHSIQVIASKVDWSKMKSAVSTVEDEKDDTEFKFRLGDGHLVKSNVNGNLYEIKVKENDSVKKGQPLMLIEVMKMSITITSPCEGVVKKIVGKTGKIMKPGDILCLIGDVKHTISL